MPNFIVEVTAEAHIGGEHIDNVFYYLCPRSLETDLSAADLFNVATAVKSHLRAPLSDCLPLDCSLTNWHAVGFKDDGTPSSANPVDVGDTAAGNVEGARDGTGNVAIIRAQLGHIEKLVSTAAEIKRAYWAIGPMVSSYITDGGDLTGAIVTTLATLGEAFVDTLVDGGGGECTAVKVSRVSSHLVTANITAYRPIIEATVRTQASTRRSRTNRR